jgi:PAS domain S-box-containing protein
MVPTNEKKAGSILLVEDDRGTCALEAQRLEPLGLELRQAHSLPEALAALETRLPDIMLVDYSLPGANALEFIETLRKSDKKVPPFIVVTGRGDEAVAVSSMKAGACDYLIKNSDFLENLLPAVKNSLEKMRLLRELEAAQRSTAKNLHLYTFLSQVNLAAAQKKDKESLFRAICEIAVGTGGLRMAWIGLPDPDLGRLIPFCWSGHIDGYLDGIRIDIGGASPAGKGPSGVAATSGVITTCSDIATEPGMAYWRARALERGYKSSCAIPIFSSGKLAAVLTVYSDQKDFFSEDEIRMLGEIQADLSLALEGITAEEERARAQAELKRTAAQLAHVMDVNPVILFSLRRRDGVPVTDWVSGNAMTLTGYSPEEILQPAWWMNNLHPDDRAKVREEQTDIYGKTSLTQDFRFRKKDGSYFWVHSQLNVTPGGKGEITGSWTDITRLKESEEQMRLLTDAVSSSFDEVYIFDTKDFHFVFVNKAAFRNLGYSAREIIQLTPWDIKHEFTPETFRKAVQPLIDGTQQLLVFESEHTRKSGSSYPVEVHLQLVESENRKLFLAVINDITERRKNATLLTEMANMQRVESLGALAGGIAHDFNNMLTGIMANLSLLTGKLSGKEEKDIIHDTLDAARSAQLLTNQLLAFSKGGKPVKQELCLEKALKEIFNLATRGAKTSRELQIDKTLWSMEGDENQIKQAVNNLLVNGLQAMPSGGTLRLKAENAELRAPTPSGLKPGKYVRLLVSDTGIGIPKEYLPRIFEPYFTTKTKGHGLGLPMTWSVITNHGGRIIPRSEPGKGTEFEVFLPATGRCLREAAEKAAQVTKGHGRILLLEDEEIVKKAAVRMLTELGYAPEVTSDGKETLKRYRQAVSDGAPFEVVIMDLTIPGGVGGAEAVKLLRSEFPDARVIVSSGYSDEAVMADYKAYGFDAVLPKPYKYEELADVLAKLLKK